MTLSQMEQREREREIGPVLVLTPFYLTFCVRQSGERTSALVGERGMCLCKRERELNREEGYLD